MQNSGLRRFRRNRLHSAARTKKYLLNGACNLTNQLLSSDRSISTNSTEENHSRKIKRTIKGFQTVRFQDHSTFKKKTRVSKADSSPKVSHQIQGVIKVEETAVPGLPKESKHIPTNISISGPSPYKPFGAATPTPIVTLKGY